MTPVFGPRVGGATYGRCPSVYVIITNESGEVALVRTAPGHEGLWMGFDAAGA